MMVLVALRGTPFLLHAVRVTLLVSPTPTKMRGTPRSNPTHAVAMFMLGVFGPRAKAINDATEIR